MLTWDLQTDKITPGQWLKHRAYTEFADLSSDGRYLIYNAATHNLTHAVGSSYVAISKPPFFTAVALYPTPGFEEGAGAFLDNRRFWVAASGLVPGGEDLLRANGLKRVARRPERTFMTGWAEVDFTEDRRFGPLAARVWSFEKPVGQGWTLCRRYTRALTSRHAGPRGNWSWLAHELHGPDGSTDLNTEWADAWQGELLFARDGCLFRMTPGAEPRRIADLTPNTFRPVRVPYAGVDLPRHRRKRWHPLEDTR